MDVDIATDAASYRHYLTRLLWRYDGASRILIANVANCFPPHRRRWTVTNRRQVIINLVSSLSSTVLHGGIDREDTLAVTCLDRDWASKANRVGVSVSGLEQDAWF